VRPPPLPGAPLLTPLAGLRSAASPSSSSVGAISRGTPLSTSTDNGTTTGPPAEENGFAALGALPETVQALEALGITKPFAIQTMTLPIALQGHDLIGQARTGTGKTLGFGVPLLQRVKTSAEGAGTLPQALVVVPTRELCVQVARDLEAAGSVRKVRVQTIYGGRAFEPQVEALARASTSSSARPAGCSTSPGRATSTCRRCRAWCSTRPTRCSTWASCPTSSASSSWSTSSARRCCSRPPCPARSSPWRGAS
jgi:Rad3-related DNA helicase